MLSLQKRNDLAEVLVFMQGPSTRKGSAGPTRYTISYITIGEVTAHASISRLYVVRHVYTN
jgi:hypothetical protein